jgi:hypothetical protein
MYTQEDQPAVTHATMAQPGSTTSTASKEDAVQAARRAKIAEQVALAKAAQEAKVCVQTYTALAYT